MCRRVADPWSKLLPAKVCVKNMNEQYHLESKRRKYALPGKISGKWEKDFDFPSVRDLERETVNGKSRIPFYQPII